jgi:2',3'-cyclic-nucleotide 2'-phosphodiesterase / 3'-nucleotidase / 5'-nucleotidase
LIKSFRFKKFASIFTALMLMLSVITPMNALADEVSSDEVTLQILATSDLHGRFYPYEYATNAKNTKGSLTQIATAIKELKKENSNTIVVDNGDTIQDNSSDLFLDGENHPMIVAMNEIGYDTWTLGNHEFNYLPKLDKIIAQSKAKVLCGNVYKPDGTRVAAPYTIVEKGGVKVGIIGMVTPNITKWDSKNLEGYKVTNPVEETKAAVEELKGKVDIMIAVEHMGLESEYNKPGSGAKELAEACPELTAIIAGHAHSKVEGEVINGVLITEPYKYGRALSKVEVKLTKKDGKYIVAGENAVASKLVYVSEKESDAELMTTLKPYHETALEDANSIVGELKGGNLVEANEIKGIPTAQISDNAMLDLINEVEMYYGKANVSSSACFRSDANMVEGPIKKSDVALIYKYDNTLKTLKINGKQLKEYMEWSVKYYNQYVDGDLTVSFDPNVRIYNYDVFSGVKYDIDISKPAGNRITNLTWMDGTPVEDTDEVKLAVNNYRADTSLMNSENGLFKDSDAEVIFDSFEEMGDAGRLRDLIRDYIVNVKGGVITPDVDNNWKITGTNFNEEDRAEVVKLINDGTLEIPTSQDGRSPNAASVNNYDLLKAKDMKQIDVICFNDFHGSVKESGKNQGIAKVAGEINKKKSSKPKYYSSICWR